MCSSFLHLAVESGDLSLAGRKLLLQAEQIHSKFQQEPF